ncbi:MAG: SDR family oxidoreductase [Eubacterium sp.]
MNSQKKVAVITGGAGGIGLATAKILASDYNYRIALIDINPEAGEKARIALSELTEATFFKCDLSKIDQVKETIKNIAKNFGRIDTLLCAAGITKHLRVMDITEEDWDHYMTLDLKSQFFVSQAVVPHMRDVGGGRIIHFSSILGSISDGKHILYGAAKTALHSIVRELAVDLWRDNIQVNAIAPAYVITPLVARHLAEPGWEKKQLAQMLLPRLIIGEDVAKALKFLVTCPTPAFNGQVLYVDGGYLNFRFKPEYLKNN